MSTPGSDFHKAIEKEFFSKAALAYPGIKTYTPNAKWVEPTNAEWFALHILSGETFNSTISMGKKVERTPLVLHISVYSPAETYERIVIEMAETAARWFANKDFRISADQYANFRAASVKTSADPKTGKFRAIATVPGYRDVLI